MNKEYELWDKQSEINGVIASDFINSLPTFMKDSEAFFLLKDNDNDMVIEVQTKEYLAQTFGVDRTLSNADFLASINERSD